MPEYLFNSDGSKTIVPSSVDHIAVEEAISELTEDLDFALDAISKVMGYDKGFSEEEWVEFCNEMLPFMKKHGRYLNTIEFV